MRKGKRESFSRSLAASLHFWNTAEKQFRIYTTIKTVRLLVTGRRGWLGIVEKADLNWKL